MANAQGTDYNKRLNYDELKDKLPQNILPAYDGMSFTF